MALSITESCVNCWACVDVCPNQAVYQDEPVFAIDADKCTECMGEFAQAQCAAICPIECAIIDELGVPLNPLGSLTGIPVEHGSNAIPDLQVGVTQKLRAAGHRLNEQTEYA